MIIVGARGQATYEQLFDASLTLTGSAQLLLPLVPSRTYLMINNPSAAAINVDFGSARATATISGGKITGITITNGGFGFALPPLVQFIGGGAGQYNTNFPTNYLGAGVPYAPSPQHPAQAQCVLTSGSVSSIKINDPGAGYLVPPYVRLINDPRDPNGAATPSASTLLIPVGGTFLMDSSAVTCDQISVIGTSGDFVVCKYM